MAKYLRAVLARNLRAALDRAQMVQEELEAKSGVGQSTISRILKQEGAATLDVIEDLAKGLGCQPWELLVDEERTREDAVRRILSGKPPT